MHNIGKINQAYGGVQSKIISLSLRGDHLILGLGTITKFTDVNASCYSKARASNKANYQNHDVEPLGYPCLWNELLEFANLSS